VSVSRIAKVGQFLVGATAAVVLVALIEAGCWVAVYSGFGAGDLWALAFWSLPFGTIVGVAGVVVRRSMRPKVRVLRGFVAAAVGGLLGLLWTLLMAQMMGPWFGTFSFPVLPILASSGALTLGVAASYLPKAVTEG
jgi:hypothetical protein